MSRRAPVDCVDVVGVAIYGSATAILDVALLPNEPVGARVTRCGSRHSPSGEVLPDAQYFGVGEERMETVVVQRRWPESVIVDWRRFACGLWREEEGDIRAACRLEDLPRAHTFKHEGQLYVPCGMIFRGTQGAEAWCHPIIRPEDYRGPEPHERGYEGRAVTVNRESFRLGPKIVFKSSEPTVAEWRSHLKILYTDGGLFAAKPTYAVFLESLTPSGSLNQSEAVSLEKSEFGNRDKETIRTLLKPKVADAFAQLSFEMKF